MHNQLGGIQTAVLGATLLLGGCVTPLHTEEKSLCHQDANQPQSQQCHYYSNQTPYIRHQPYDAQLMANNEKGHPSLQDASLLTMQQVALASGDRLNVEVLHGDDFSGQVEVNPDGYIYLPYLPAIKAKGLSLEQLKNAVSDTLISEQLMHAHAVRVSIVPLKWGAIEVRISGAVYEPGIRLINKKSEIQMADEHEQFSGDLASERSLAAALRSSGGVRPDADITRVIVSRNNQRFNVDLTGFLTGQSVPHFNLVAGDHIHVPQTAHFNDELARPSQITIPGIRVFISNLTQPASSNSQSAVDTEATRFPYGTRLLSGAIGANCVGGANTTNADRHVLLITKNPITQQMDVVERSINNLIANSYQSKVNPILLPGDGLACYDSRITNIREIARTFTDILLPATLWNAL